MKTKLKLEIAAPGDGGSHILCKIRINGHKMRALIDTGASRSILARDALSKLGISGSGGISSMGIGAEPLQTETVNIDLALKKIKLKSFEVGVLDMNHIHEAYKELGMAPFQFILGGDILILLDAEIRYSRKIIVLKK